MSLKTVMFVTKQGHLQGTVADKLPSVYERLNILISLFQCLCYSIISYFWAVIQNDLNTEISKVF